MNLDNLKSVVKSRGLNNRILIWGACEKNDAIRDIFEEWGCSVCGYIDRNYLNMGTYRGLRVFGSEILAKKGYFVYIGLTGTYSEVLGLMQKYGYLEFEDYWYPLRKVILMGTENYMDKYGNVLTTDCNTPLRVILCDGGKIVLESCEFAEKCVVAADRADIRIEKGSKFGNGCVVSSSNGVIRIGKKCIVAYGCKFRTSCRGIIEMQDNCTVNRLGAVCASMNAKVMIGKDCMISYYVLIRAGNSHNIFDIKPKKISI